VTGARGLTVAGSNAVPAEFVRMFERHRDGRQDEARRSYYTRISPMMPLGGPRKRELAAALPKLDRAAGEGAPA